MKNLKELIKPGYIVDIDDSEFEEYRYIVVDASGELGLHSLYEPGCCISLSNFDNNLINTEVSRLQRLDVNSAIKNYGNQSVNPTPGYRTYININLNLYLYIYNNAK